MKSLDIGNSDFKSVIENDHYYVDKSLFIEEVIRTQNQVILIPRPRRFGKTLNLSMLRYYFEKDVPSNRNLFTHLQIWKCSAEIVEKQGKYPVIYLSFKDARGLNWEDSLDHITSEIRRMYAHHDYLLKGETLKDYEKKGFEEILFKTARRTEYESSLKQLSEYLYRYHSERVVILMDEYDTPIHSGYGHGYYDEVVSFLRNFLSGAFKDNGNLYRGVLTGILRVSRESLFSGLNNLGVFTILDSPFSDKFGFTGEEVNRILEDLQIPTSYEQVKSWYDGYTFGKQSALYNPWSILNYVVGYKNGFKPYWVNTSSDDLLKKRIQERGSDRDREMILHLLNGESIQKSIDENFVFPDMNTNKELLWTLLFFGGYLTIGTTRKELDIVTLRIPNYELKFVFKNIILYWFNTELKILRNLLETTANSLVNHDLTRFREGFQKILGDTFSYYDTVGEAERVYQAYVLGMLAILSDDYVVRSNRESGEGRYDIALIPKDKNKNGVVMEIKQLERKPGESDSKLKSRIQRSLNRARKQMEKNRYSQELVDHGVKNILSLPIVFVGKQAYL